MDITIFTRQLATMMKAGVPLVQSFEIVAEGLDNPSMREVVLGIKAEVEGGSTALRPPCASTPCYFDDLFCSLVNSGEQSGALETMLDRVAQYKEKSELLKMKIKKAMKYPTTVVVVAAIVTVILLLKVVPVFQELFSGFRRRVARLHPDGGATCRNGCKKLVYSLLIVVGTIGFGFRGQKAQRGLS
jgi:type IV pilus assembly protein PilC